MVIAITGGSRGIGLATARELVARGARVSIGDLDAEQTRTVATGLGGAIGLPLDVTDRDSFAGYLARTEEELGGLDVVINNAGVMPLGRFVDESEHARRRTFEVNALGVLTGMQLALSAMLPRGRGQIVNVASAAGRAPVPGGLTYGATKAAVVSATETARVEYRDSGIEFTCVLPSFTNTELISGTSGTRFIENVEAEDVARAIVAAIASPRNDVFVPASLGAIFRVYAITGRRLRDLGNRLLGADRTFLEADATQRAGYDGRAGLTEPTDSADRDRAS